MRIPSGVTDQGFYFVAVDATDYVTRETGLSSFTVVRSRNGAADATMSTPTITEIDNTAMPGVYFLLCDEDMTLAAGNHSEAMAYHITHAGMAPVTQQIELYRPDVTAGETLTVSSGTGNAAVQSVANGAITAAAIATDAIDADALAADAIAEINATVDTALADYDGPTNTEMVAAFTEIKGATWATTDTLEAIRDRGDSAWITATGFSTHSAADVRSEMDSNSTQLAAIVADTNELQTDWADGGRLDLILDARASQASVNTIDGIVDDILLDTAEIGAAGAGLTEAGGDGDHLTAINLPDQTMNITGNITGNLSGSVGSVTGNVGGNVVGSVGSVTGAINTAAGTITTLDDLDTAQDSQHSTTQSALTTVDSNVDAIKAKTDSLTYTVAGKVDANIEYVNGTEVTGAGTEADPWGP